MNTVPRDRPAGVLLREWRERRHLSQLQLAAGAAVSSRHLSFIETGRSNPSREMVLHLAERLDLPLRERNRLLLAAGYAPVFGERPLDGAEMDVVRETLERFLSAHEPFPALVADGRWNIVMMNTPVTRMLDGVAAHLLEPPVNGLRVTLHPDGLGPAIVNFAEWTAHVLRRLDREIASSGDAALVELREELLTYPGVGTDGTSVDLGPSPDILVPLRLRRAGCVLSFFATQTVFGTPNDVTLAELSIEAFYPADEETAQALRAAG